MKNTKLENKSIDDILNFYQKEKHKYDTLFLKQTTYNPILSSLKEKIYTYLIQKNGNKFYPNVQHFFLQSKEFQELEEDYLYLLHDILLLGNNYHLENITELFSIFSYLLQNGYLSLNHEFLFSKNVKEEILYFFPLSIIDGKASCRHIAPFLTDLLKMKGYCAFNSSILLNDQFNLYSFNDELKEEDNFYEENDMNNLEIEFNHIITFVTNENSSVFLDPTNHTIYFIDKNLNVFPIYSKEKIDNIGFDKYFNQNSDIANVSKLIKPTKQNLKQILKEYKKTLNVCHHSKETLEKFYLEHIALYEQIIQKKKVLYKKQGEYFKETLDFNINEYL